jgi:hypothetical protein
MIHPALTLSRHCRFRLFQTAHLPDSRKVLRHIEQWTKLGMVMGDQGEHVTDARRDGWNIEPIAQWLTIVTLCVSYR